MHVYAPELRAAQSPPIAERLRYAKVQWAHGPKWATHEVTGERWMGFESVRPLEGVDVDVAMVPLVGHSIGHTGIAVKEGDGWKLHCGDAYFHHTEVATPPSCPAGLRLFQNIVGTDRRTRLQNQERLRDLAAKHADEVRLFCSHSHVELEREQRAVAAPGQ